jgi:hypothetical protein
MKHYLQPQITALSKDKGRISSLLNQSHFLGARYAEDIYEALDFPKPSRVTRIEPVPVGLTFWQKLKKHLWWGWY